MKIAVVGSRNWQDTDRVRRFMRRTFSVDDMLVSGHGGNVDLAAENEALFFMRIACEIYPSQWKRHGRAGGPIRNSKIVSACDVLYAFRDDGQSDGTDDVVRKARALGKPVYVFGPNDEAEGAK